MQSVKRSSSIFSEIDASESKASVGNHIKHPLHNQWTLWYLEYDASRTWGDMLNKVTSFDTVEDFWCLQHHIVDPADLRDLNDYCLFKNNIRPMWEDSANKYGGRWIINLGKQQRRTDLNNMWLDTMLYMIGGMSHFENDINGAVVNVRSRGDKISIWTADYQNKFAINGIGMELKKYLGTDARIIYEMHSSYSSKSSKPMLVL